MLGDKKMFFIGLDSGSTTTKGVLFKKNSDLLGKYLIPTGGDPRGAMKEIVDYFIDNFDLRTGDYSVVTTGYGRDLWDSDLTITEISCHGKGADFLRPGVEQVIDIGGQDCKTISLNGNGNVLDFNMNDRCAAGTGRFVEVMMRTLGEDIDKIDKFVEGGEAIKINSMCTVFAESEVISLLSKGEKREDIAVGVLYSIARRISGQYSKLDYQKGSPILFTGGLSRSAEFTAILSECVGAPTHSHPLSQYAGAIGAALIGFKKIKK